MSSINEAAVFDYMEYEVKRIGVNSLSISVSEIAGNYVAVYGPTGRCGIGKTFDEAAKQLPDLQQQAAGMIKTAEELEAQAKAHREKAAKLLGQ